MSRKNRYQKTKVKQKKNNKKNFNYKNNKKIKNPANQFQIEIDEHYNEIYKNDITQTFINYISNNSADLNTLCMKVFKLVENNKIEYIEQVYKEKLTTLICILFPFAKSNKSLISGHIFKSDLLIDKDLFDYLKKGILVNDDSKTIIFRQNKIENFSKNFLKDLFLDSTQEAKNIIISCYTFLIISRCLRKFAKGKEKLFFDDLLKKEILISFKIHFILEHQEYYPAISDDFIDVYNGLHFINVFYHEIFCENNEKKRIMKDEKMNKYIFGKDKFVLSLENNYDFDIDILFSKKDNDIYKETLKLIEYFYSIKKYDSNDINDLINYSTNKIGNVESNFILKIVEHVDDKFKYIYKDINKYRKKLIELENKIYSIGKETLNISQSKIMNYTLNQSQKNAFESLLKEIKNNIPPKYKDKFNLYPYGSVTQFLGGKSSDIDIYLNIRQIYDDNEKSEFLKSLYSTIGKITNQNTNYIISSRLLVIKCKYYYFGTTTDFDVSLMGFCPYIHSTILRSYSLMDPRFPLLAIFLKKFIEKNNIKNTDRKIEFLNSFSWMILLITFLQDIINPPILPKILSDKKNVNFYLNIQYGHNEKNKYSKNFLSFVKNIKEENTQLPQSLFDKNLISEIYKERIEKKNNLSCAEIFLSFLEFIIYYFKSDSIYVNFSIENEGYESLHNILNYNDINEKNKKDERFAEYFKKVYCKAQNFADKKKTRDGLILIRDPVDPHYNPGQSLRVGCYNEFMENLKKGYLELIKYDDN